MIAFVLSGGGNRGALQAGALEVLIERGIIPQLIVCTSVGALNGVVLAATATPEGVRRQAANWAHIRRSDVFPGNGFTVAWRVLTGQGSLHSRENFARFVLSTLPPNVRRFKDLKIPCIVTATSLNTGQLRLFGLDSSERLLDALLASTAIPPFFPPYSYQNEQLLDGALVANLPLSHAIQRGARTIYTLEIVDDMAVSSRQGLRYTLTSSLNAMLNRQHEQERQVAALAHARGITIHDIKLTSGQSLAYNDFSHSAELVEAGRRSVIDYLDAHHTARTAPFERLTGSLREAFRTLGARRGLPPPAPPAAPNVVG